MAATQAIQDRVMIRFRRWDRDHSGQLCQRDLEREARRVLDAFGEPHRSPRGRAVMSRYEDIWNYLTAKAGGVHVVTREQFEVIGAAHANGEGAPWFSMLRRYMTAMVQLCDTDGDGKVQPPEFSKWVEAVNFGFGARIDTSVAFKSVDTNGDGSVSVDELCAAQKAYDEGTLDVSLLG